MDAVTIFGPPQSNFVWATRLALAARDIPHELLAAAPHSPEVLAIHPLGRVPAMRHGAVAIGESRAIIDYVDRTFPGAPFGPTGPAAAALAESWTSIVATVIEPVVIRTLVFAYFFPNTEDGAPDRRRIDQALPVVETQLDALEAGLERGEFGGEGVTRVDFYLPPVLFYLRNTPEGAAALAARPALSGYLNHHLASASMRMTMPPPLPGRARP